MQQKKDALIVTFARLAQKVGVGFAGLESVTRLILNWVRDLHTGNIWPGKKKGGYVKNPGN